MPMSLRSIALPTPAEVLQSVPELLATLFRERTDAPRTTSVSPCLEQAFHNPDEPADLSRFSELDRAYLERQIARTERDFYIKPLRSPWKLVHLAIAPLTDWSNRSNAEGVLVLEVPLFTIDRRHAILRGQWHDAEDAIPAALDFHHVLVREGDQWTLT